MSTGRLESFSDGVIAIAITLLVLGIHVPAPSAGASLAHELAQQWPSYAAYVTSFLSIGIVWINHHAMVARLRTVDHAVLLLNLLLLLLIGVLPWSTELMAEYLRRSSGEDLAAAIYAGSFLAMSASFLALQRHVLIANTDLLHDHVDAAARRAIYVRNRAGLVPYLLATALAAVSPYLTLALCAGLAVYYAIPSRVAPSPPAGRPPR